MLPTLLLLWIDKNETNIYFQLSGEAPKLHFPRYACCYCCGSFSLLNGADWNCQNNTTLYKNVKIHVIMPPNIPQKPYDLLSLSVLLLSKVTIWPEQPEAFQFPLIFLLLHNISLKSRTTESQHHQDWKGPQQIIKSTPLLKQVPYNGSQS